MSAAQIYGRKVDYVEEFILNLCKSFKSLEDTQNNDGYVNRARVKRWPYKMHGHVKFTPVAQFSSNYRAFFNSPPTPCIIVLAHRANNITIYSHN